MSLGLTFEKLLLILLVGVLVIGPERLPLASSKLAQLLRATRAFIEVGKERIRREVGTDVDPQSWRDLDPRQYDPRRIIRDALLEGEDSAQSANRSGDSSPPAFGIRASTPPNRKAHNAR
jgi:sec-independent protein translocase protein TatB